MNVQNYIQNDTPALDLAQCCKIVLMFYNGSACKNRAIINL